MGGFLLGFHQYGLEEMENVAHSVLEVIFFNAQINYLTGRKDTAKQNSSFISALQSYLFLSKI